MTYTLLAGSPPPPGRGSPFSKAKLRTQAQVQRAHLGEAGDGHGQGAVRGRLEGPGLHEVGRSHGGPAVPYRSPTGSNKTLGEPGGGGPAFGMGTARKNSNQGRWLNLGS